MSLGACASSTLKIEVVTPTELLLGSELQVHGFSALPKAPGVTQKLTLCLPGELKLALAVKLSDHPMKSE